MQAFLFALFELVFIVVVGRIVLVRFGSLI